MSNPLDDSFPLLPSSIPAAPIPPKSTLMINDPDKGNKSLAHPDNLFNRLSGFSFDSIVKNTELNLPDNIEHRTIKSPGRKVGDTCYTLEEKIQLGMLGNLVGIRATAEAYGVNKDTVTGYTHGSTEQRKRLPNEELKNALDAKIEEVKNNATVKMALAIDAITNEAISKLGQEKPLLSADLAVKMSTVIEKLSNKDRVDVGNAVQIIIHGPEERNESKYDTIDVALNLEDR